MSNQVLRGDFVTPPITSEATSLTFTTLAGALVGVLLALPAAAQSGVTGIAAGYEAAYDRFHYYFENPSTFDTPELVPHNFRQTYWGDNHWLVVSARYRIAAYPLETALAMSSPRETRGDDVDTFFQRSGDVATSGTSGRVDMRSFRIRQDAPLGAFGGLEWRGFYQYRRDRQEFHVRQIKTVTHTQPPSRESFPIDGAETTISSVHEVGFGMRREWTARQWRLDARLDAAPATFAWLTTILPIKYPGREIVFVAPVLTLAPSLTLTRGERWPIAIRVGATRTVSYMQGNQFQRRALTVALQVGRSR